MPWYYVGPEATPVGPVTLDELNARHRSGAITPETYVIEHSGAPGAPGEWRRYREIFPATNYLPPVPPAIPPPPPVAAHPLFPSAAHAPTVPASVPIAAPHAYFPVARKTNPWCAWGFGLGIAAFVLSFACGVGLLVAVPALFICILGFVQLQRHPEQTGRGLAAAGGVLSVIALIVALIWCIYFIPRVVKEYEQTSLEQSSSNSE